MDFSDWYKWIRSLPSSMVWFPLLILLRPFIDTLYYLKKVSPFFSPLYIVGVLTPFLCLYAVLKFRLKIKTISDLLFRYWSAILLFTSALLLIIYSFEIDSFILFFKLTLPFFLFPFLRIFINSRKDLHGILQTFLYSCILAIILFFFSKVTGQEHISFSRGLERESGFNADIGNYSFYITFGFLVYAYFNLTTRRINSAGKQYFSLPLVIGICILGLVSIKHLATIGVFLALLLLYLFIAMKKSILYTIFIIVFLAGFYSFFGQKIINESFNPLVGKEVEVLKGTRDQSHLLHGRVGRWPEMIAVFFSYSPIAVLFGSSLSFNHETSVLVSGIVHNDYLRILFSTGIFGIFLYIAFLTSVYVKTRKLLYFDKFLVLGSLAALALYSITMNPNLYPNLCYILYSIFAFLLLPGSVKYAYNWE